MTLEKTAFAILILAVSAFAGITWEESRSDRARLELAIASQQQIIGASENRERTRDAALKITLAQIAATKKDAGTPTQILSALQQSLELPQAITLQANTENTLGKGITKSQNPADFPASPATRIHISGSNRNDKHLVQPQSSSPPATVNDSAESEASSSDFSNSSISNLKYEIRGFFARKSQFPANSALSAGDHPSPDGNVVSLHSNPAETTSIPIVDLKPLLDNIENCHSSDAQLATAQADLADEKNRSASLTKERDAAMASAKGGNLWHHLERNSKWLAVGAALTALMTRIH
jgi:hypothetical protein